MSESAVMTLRMPKRVKQEVERLASRFGQKPAQLGVRLIEEGLRKRDFPHVDLRETASGRVAYIAGTRFAVHWVAGLIPGRMSVQNFAKEYDVPAQRVRMALAYAEAFPNEIASDQAQVEANRQWIAAQSKSSANALAVANMKAKPFRHAKPRSKGQTSR